MPAVDKPKEEADNLESPEGFRSPTPILAFGVVEDAVKRRVVDGEAEEAIPGCDPLLDRETMLLSLYKFTLHLMRASRRVAHLPWW